MKYQKEYMVGGYPEMATLFAYIKGNASAEEKRIVDEWLANDEANEKELLQIARIYYAEQTYERMSARNPLSAFSHIEKKIKKKNQRFRLKRIAAVAACIAGVIVMSAVFSYRKGDAISIEPQWITVKSNPGMRTHITLADGTVAHLNAGSSLTYPIPYDKEERNVALKGEAFFLVTPNEEQPFIVSVLEDKLKVRVLGTEFNIQAYEDDDIVQTTLVTGLVNLEISHNNQQYERQLHPSERAIFDIVTNKMRVEKVNPVFDIAWIEGKLIFKDTPIPEVLKRLSYFYNVKFEIKDPVIKDYRFTGTFVDRHLSQVLDYLKISSNIDFEIHRATEDDSNGMKYTVITLWKKIDVKS